VRQPCLSTEISQVFLLGRSQRFPTQVMQCSGRPGRQHQLSLKPHASQQVPFHVSLHFAWTRPSASLGAPGWAWAGRAGARALVMAPVVPGSNFFCTQHSARLLRPYPARRVGRGAGRAGRWRAPGRGRAAGHSAVAGAVGSAPWHNQHAARACPALWCATSASWHGSVTFRCSLPLFSCTLC